MISTIHWTAVAFMIAMLGTPITPLAWIVLGLMVLAADQMMVWPIWWASGQRAPAPVPGLRLLYRLRRFR